MMRERYEYIKSYIDSINKELNNNLCPEIKPASILRYALYANCIEGSLNVWDDVFDCLADQEKKLSIIVSYAFLWDAAISTRNLSEKPKDFVNLEINPNVLIRDITNVMCVPFCCFEEVEIITYLQKKKLFSADDSKGTFFKIGDEIRGHIMHYKVINVYFDGEKTMVKVCSLHDPDNPDKILLLPESEMVGTYRITNPVEFQID